MHTPFLLTDANVRHFGEGEPLQFDDFATQDEAFEAQGGSMCVSVPAWSSGVLVRGLGGTWREHPEGCAGERAAMGGVRPSTTAQSCTVAGPDLKRCEAARGVCASCLPAFPAFRLIHYR